jgi:type IV fimbrial biogenesis protein FimT
MATASPMARRERGFTLIELMITITIMSVLLVVVAPSFQSAMLSNRLASYANDWVAVAQVARGEAIKRNAAVTLCRSTDQSTCATSGTWQQGWVLRASDGTVIATHEALSTDYKFKSCTSTTPGATCSDSGTYSISFQPTGLISSSMRLWLCRSSPSVGNQEREIEVQLSGKPYVKRYQTSSCG